jgi:hypothetical protein
MCGILGNDTIYFLVCLKIIFGGSKIPKICFSALKKKVTFAHFHFLLVVIKNCSSLYLSAMLKLSVTFFAIISLHLISYVGGSAQCAAKEEAEAFLSTIHRHHIAPLENSAANQQSIIYQYIQLVDPVHVLYSENDAAELL